MEQKFLEFVANVMGVETGDISLDTAYKEFAPWDSIMFLRLVMELEDEYGVSIPMEKFESLNTLGDFFRLLRKD